MGLYDYMTESERELAIYSRLTENRINHIGLEIDKLMLEHAEHVSACELKVLMESGTDADMEYFYAIEAEEVKEKSKGLIGRLFDAIITFISKIKNALFGKAEEVKEENLPDTIEVSEDPKKVTNEGRSIIKGIKDFFSNNKETLKKFGAGAAIAAVATGTVYELNKHDAIPVIKDLKEFIATTDKEVRESQKKASKMETNGEDASTLKKGIAALQRSLSKAQNVLKSIVSAAGGDPTFKDIQDKNKAEREANKQEKKDTKQQAKIDKSRSKAEYHEASVKSLEDQMKKIDDENKKLTDEIAAAKKQITSDVKSKKDTPAFDKLFRSFDSLYNEYKTLGSKKDRTPKEDKRLRQITEMFDRANIGSRLTLLRSKEDKIRSNNRHLDEIRRSLDKSRSELDKSNSKTNKLELNQMANKY